MRVLVIEDDPAIGRMIRRGLEDAHYYVTVEETGTGGFRAASEQSYSLIVLDVMLPGMDGMEICRRLRERKVQTPILMLTAKDAVEDRVQGLQTGADDYLPKPFDFREFMARVQALLRRDKVVRTPKIIVADLEIDVDAHSVTRSGQEIRLSRREYDLLLALAQRTGHVLTREAVRDRIWNSEDSFSNTVDVTVGTLRKKVDSGFATRLIHTVHGVGYVMRVPEEGD